MVRLSLVSLDCSRMSVGFLTSLSNTMLMHLSELDVPGSHSYPATGVKGVARDARAPQSPLKTLASVLASSHSYPLGFRGAGSHSYPTTGVKDVATGCTPQSPLKPLASVLASSHSYTLASGERSGVVVFFWGDFPYEPSIAPEVQNS